MQRITRTEDMNRATTGAPARRWLPAHAPIPSAAPMLKPFSPATWGRVAPSR
ncbi:MAG TPA: hypothetical protein VK629_21015 [Steroidobacteraceae bacterium]|nr:hypothetical protein [Steroidobacteraceae bacterium]